MTLTSKLNTIKTKYKSKLFLKNVVQKKKNMSQTILAAIANKKWPRKYIFKNKTKGMQRGNICIR